MKWRAIYHQHVAKEDLPKIPGNLRKRIKRAIELRLLPAPISSGQPLRRSLRNYKKLRVGDYRIIYRIKGSDVCIFVIGQRKEVYRGIFGRF